MTIRNQTSARFRDEIHIVPNWVFFLASLIFLAVIALFGVVLGMDRHAPPLAVRIPLAIAAGTVVACYVVLIGYVNRDAGRRRMSRVLWTLIAIFIPNGLGIVLYFVLRKPRPVHCPQCEAEVEPGFSFCPLCRNRLQPVCPHCQRSIESGDKFCPYCGTDQESAAGANAVANPSSAPGQPLA
jgi:hypothetical protein